MTLRNTSKTFKEDIGMVVEAPKAFLRIVHKNNSGIASQEDIFKENFQNYNSGMFKNHGTMEMLKETDDEYTDSVCFLSM